MILIKSILFLAIVSLTAVALGHVITSRIDTEEGQLGFSFILGFFMMISIFDIIALVLTFKRGTVTTLLLIWIGVIAVILFLELFFNWKKLIQMIKESIKGIFTLNPLIIVFLIMVFFQILYVCVMWHSDADDATYVGQATTAYFTNMISSFEYETGTAITRLTTYHLAPIGVFWAMLGKLFMLHPAIIMHVLCPVLLIPLCYMIYVLIGRYMFNDQKQLAVFLIFVSIIILFANYSIRSVGTFMLFRIWQGKAFICSAVIPLLMYLTMKERKKAGALLECLILILVSVAACSFSGMGPILVIAFLGIVSIKELIVERKFVVIVKYIIAGIPCLFRAFLFFTY